MKYTIGIDYGTQSARAQLLNISTKGVVAKAEEFYPHGVMSEQLPSGIPLGKDWAIQDGDDYFVMAINCIKSLLATSKINPEDVIGLGIDTTACTMIPLGSDLEPLSSNPLFKDTPNAYVKLWKHHAAQKYANELNKIAEQRGEEFLKRYGGKISSEWSIPKIMQIAAESPEVYAETSCFADIADWLGYKLTGKLYKNNVTTGYKTLWSDTTGFPSSSFFKDLNPLMEHVVEEKLSEEILEIGQRAGFITEEVSALTGLSQKTAVAVPHTDAGVVPITLGMGKNGQMIASIGTSTCHFLLSDTLKEVPGICGVIKDGAVPGFYAYEAGQTAVGDSFSWFVDNFVGEKLHVEASQKGVSLFSLLGQKAERLVPGESGLVALDWFNGNRSILVNSDLSSVIVGLTINTKAEEVYRAILESTAFGTRKIIENFREYGVEVTELYACGGIPKKDPFMMQLYADICDIEIRVSDEALAAAYGSAMLGAVAAGRSAGGYENVHSAEDDLGLLDFAIIKPNPKNVVAYDKLYEVFNTLHDAFSKDNSVIYTLKALREAAKA
ncbi:ribulokinase [uncultured Sphaerochaeta sp.]|uniref:ribulokinase n=1 Tax=uncultured Sphaerochaeta sp. TaxID=886478 RepID=UPI002A0A5526|nr:ribulokinase [uncultured Sphaerochaeta sp.]